MSVCGVVAEYNPFHNGHAYHLRESKKFYDGVVCVLSGNFTQRGEPAIADKWQRATWAVAGGADLVLELPLVYATGSAESFAEGAVRTLCALGVVDAICFGGEIDTPEFFQNAAACQESDDYAKKLRENLLSGMPYHGAASAAMESLLPYSADVFALPNNILGIEYAKAVRRWAPKLSLHPIQRRGAQYRDKAIASHFASATAIRETMRNGAFTAVRAVVPPAVWQTLNSIHSIPSLEDISLILLAKLRLSSPCALKEIDNISEGLEYKFIQSAHTAVSIQEILSNVKSARYPRSRLQRVLLHVLFHITTETMSAVRQNGPPYIRVLAFNDRGRALLKTAKSKSSLPLVLKTTRFLSSRNRQGKRQTLLERILSLDTYATDLYDLLQKKSGGRDFTQSPLYLKCFSFQN